MVKAVVQRRPRFPLEFIDSLQYNGPGLFLDKRAATSIRQARSAVLVYLRSAKDSPLCPNFRAVWRKLRNDLVDVASHYWAERDYYARMTLSELRRQTRLFQRRLQRYQEGFKAMPRRLAVALNDTIGRSEEQPIGTDYVERAMATNASLDRACKHILDSKGKKYRDCSVENACARLWNLLEGHTGRSFTGTLTTCETRQSHRQIWGPLQFDRTDALFVQVVMQALDSSLQLSVIKEGLKQASAKKNAARKRSDIPT